MYSEPNKNEAFADLLGQKVLFMHDVLSVRGWNPPSTSKLQQRAMFLARPDDVVVFRGMPDVAYAEWLDESGFGTRNVVVADGDLTQTMTDLVISNRLALEAVNSMLDSESAVVSHIQVSAGEQQASDSLGLFSYSNPVQIEHIDSKLRFKDLCQRLGVPVSEYALFENEGNPRALSALISDMIGKTGRAIVRSEFRAGNYLFDNPDPERVEKLVEEGLGNRYLVEPLHDVSVSPSSQWFITREGRPIKLGLSKQILKIGEGIAYSGNEFNHDYDDSEITESSLRIVREMAKEGFIGPLGFDFITTSDGSLATECNPRINFSIYPLNLLKELENRHGPVGVAVSKTVATSKDGTFEDMKTSLGEMLYDGREGTGRVVPFDTGALKQGLAAFLVTGSSVEEANQLLARTERALA
jgi:hypothetical protein